MRLGATVRRTGSIAILGAWSDDPNSRLTPYGARVRVERGIRLPDGSTEWCVLMTGRITETSQGSDDHDALMTVALKDDFSALVRDRFDVATSTNTAELVVDAIRRLITETLPGRTVHDLTGSTRTCGRLDLQQDRAAGIQKLALSIGAECYAGRDDSFVIAPTATLDDQPRWELSVGETGNLITVERSRDAEKTYNRVVARGYVDGHVEHGSAPPYAAAQIDPPDPLYYGGPFGKVTRFFASPYWRLWNSVSLLRRPY